MGGYGRKGSGFGVSLVSEKIKKAIRKEEAWRVRQGGGGGRAPGHSLVDQGTRGNEGAGRG